MFKREFLDRCEAAEFLFQEYGLGDGDRKYLDNLAQRNVGPSYYMIRSKPLYDFAELQEWARRKQRVSTPVSCSNETLAMA